MKSAFSYIAFAFAIVLPFVIGTTDRKPSSVKANDEYAFGWRETFMDDFTNADQAISRGADPKCFSKKPLCANEFEWDQSECDAKYHTQLKDLNKCTWTVFNFYNYMDFDAPVGQGINSFSPSEVKVENGNLVLSADRSTVSKNQINCKNKYVDTRYGIEAFTRDCGVVSGGVSSRKRTDWTTNQETGTSQTYGRFEVRAKLSKGQGSWPAIWMMPDNAETAHFPEQGPGCGWPFIGEMDIMEQWSDNFKSVQSQWIHGYCQQNLDVRKNFTTKSNSFQSEFHVYGLEWGPNSLCFFTDDTFSGCIYKDDLVKAKNISSGNYDGKRNAWIPDYPFHYLLNLSIERALDKGKVPVDLDTFSHQEMVIDYVRSFRKCTPEDPKEKCENFMMKGEGVNGYNTYKNETAFADINVYPNPTGKSSNGGNVTMKFRLYQDCQKVQINMVNMAGQLVPVHVEGESSREFIFNGPLMGDETITKQIGVTHLASGMYLVYSAFEECGYSKAGKGNHVFKLVVIEDREMNKKKKEIEKEKQQIRENSRSRRQ